eukprot:CAMPEP_0113937774 /NCGR_PEP_ID=MMETSP1339-20121228/4320_1 /TAXON_ID=94617 /ORGANISM="Fibrocapsa japonica" /LENGTH=572 /DNA_ID=CAMNT_0000940673 /DNA_START=71 /DNA_END=1789 /DNA_ORIENTATION=+ /assembly_acc=CAM_ASM_000762
MSAEEFKAKGNEALKSKNYDEAIEMYTKAIDLDSSNHVFFSNRSAAHLSKGDASEALKDAESCIKLKPDWPKGHGRKGAALHSLHQYEEAVQAYQQGLAACPGDAALASGLEEVEKVLRQQQGPPGGPPGGNPFAQAFGPDAIARLASNPKFASYLADPTFVMKLQMLQKDPNQLQSMMQDPRILEVFGFLMGLDFSSMPGAGMGGEEDVPPPPAPAPAPAQAPPPEPMEEENDDDLTEEEKAEKAKKKQALDEKKKGNELYKAKDFDGAIAAYQAARDLDPTNITYLNNMAAVEMEKKDFDKCIELCREAIELGRANRAKYEDLAKAFVRMAKACHRKGDLQGAIDHYNSAQVENYTKEVERAIKKVQAELKKKEEQDYINPEKGVEAKEKGNEFFRAGKFAEAINEYREATKRDPTNAAYHNNLAAALSKLGDFNTAKEACEKALQLDPTYVKAWAKKGDIEFFMKEYHKALESYKKGLEVESNNPLCQQGLQRTAQKINEANMSGEVDMERAQHGMADPEVQAILSDPVIRNVLRDFQENPMEAQKALADPTVRAKIEKLMAAGVLQAK